jgi:YqjK-like protein
MSALAEILERRARLVAEAEAQRHELTASLAGCRGVLAVVDRGIAWAGWLRARPYLVVVAAAAIALLRPKFVLGWSARLLALWPAGRFLYSVIRPAAGDRAP